MLLIQTQRVPTTPVHTAQPHAPLHYGQISCAHHVLLPWGPLIAGNSRAQSRTQRSIQAAQPQWTHIKAPGSSPLFGWLAGLPGGLDWPVILTLPPDKVCFQSRARPFPDFRCSLHPISNWKKIQRKMSPHPVLREDKTFQLRQFSYLLSLLWNKTLHLPGPNFRLSLSFPQSPCLLPIIMVNSLHRPLLKEHWTYQSDTGMDDPMHVPGY